MVHQRDIHTHTHGCTHVSAHAHSQANANAHVHTIARTHTDTLTYTNEQTNGKLKELTIAIGEKYNALQLRLKCVKTSDQFIGTSMNYLDFTLPFDVNIPIYIEHLRKCI